MATEAGPNRTLFVRNLPYDATNESLESIFSEIGPVKSAFVVAEKGILCKNV